MTKNGNYNRPTVTIVSPFRDNEYQIDLYIEQINKLAYEPSLLRIVCVEGDSTDDTFHRLANWAIRDQRVSVVKYDTQRPKYPSIVSEERFYHLGDVFTKCIRSAAELKTDYVMFLPSDLVFNSFLVTNLLDCNKDMIAPMFWIGDGPHGRFYDIWGFKKYGGDNFGPYTPIWYRANLPDEPVQMDTIGGCILMRREIIDAGCKYTSEEVDHGLCKMAYEAGFTVWCDPMTHVWHR